MYQINFYVPESHLEKVKETMFAAGAGRIGDYERCAWQTKGEGQFCPKVKSKPFIGEINQLERVIEYKVEMVCEDKYVKDIVKALKTSHPYEEPAYSVIKIAI